MMDADPAAFDRITARLHRAIWALAAFGSAAGGIFGGWRWGLAFLAGAAAGYVNFRWLHHVVAGLGPDARPTNRGIIVLLALRFVLLAAGGYVIVKVFSMSMIAAASGLFVPVAAAIFEGLYELVHGT